MPDDAAAVALQVRRQVAHWRTATAGLENLEDFASARAWASLEEYLGVALRAQLTGSVEWLRRNADLLGAELAAAATPAEIERVRRLVVRFRHRFVQVETALDFYGDAVGTRTNDRIAAMLRACDTLARQGIAAVFDPLGRPVPPVLTYVDKGLGASILRTGLRLWDGRSLSAAAAIKVTRHNLGSGRPTAVMHEAGHQVAFTLGWNDELAAAFRREFRRDAPAVGQAWAGWASELAADAFAVAHLGYGAVAALHDVIAGEDARVWLTPPGDPHPPAALRVLANTTMVRTLYGAGPWDALARSWELTHPAGEAPEEIRRIYEQSRGQLHRVADVLLTRRARAFDGRALTELVDPQRVRPDALQHLAAEAGTALFTSPYWIRTEALRLLALSSHRAAVDPERSVEITRQYEDWMTRLGDLAVVA